MSQFFGYIVLNPQIKVSEVSSQMTENMSFFREDAIGIYQTDEVFICNKFLFNTPESVNTTNICQNERYVLAATCRIDNREELATKISIENPLNASDHEYILAAFTYYQEKCVEHLLGDFSFVVWDKQEQTLFLAKDHLGIKPLFYYKDENFLLFSTYIHGIKGVKSANLALDELYIARELKNFSATYEDTFFLHIKRLKPAHFVRFNPQNSLIQEQKYWELNPIDIAAFKTEEEIYEELRRLFTQAVVCRTRTNKNIGCQLSGGLDSSAIAVLLARNIDKNRLHTYSFVLSDKTRAYSEKGIDEQETQNIIIEYADLKRENHHKIEEFHYEDVFEEFEKSNLIMGGYANSDSIWQDTLFKKAGDNHVGYIMSGFPGDEGVSNNGDLYFYDYIGNKQWKEIAQLIISQKLLGLKKIAAYYYAKYTGTYMRGYQRSLVPRSILNPQSPFDKELTRDNEAFKFYPTFKEFLKNQVCRSHTCHRTESEGLYAAQYGVETVYPLADIRLLAMLISIPTQMFAPQNYNRVIFRKICYHILPEQVRIQVKHNGAFTLAFFEYWYHNNLNMLKDYRFVNSLGLIDTQKEFDTKGLINLIRSMKRYSLDYLISKNVK
ncbi:MAG: asparagine synthase-related protein [Flavobacterium sp.]|jgi:asparagine synthase (glutamine-hydrolysing)|nr:asparagine synthase-related protein [Flavobacterium sp.]